MWLCPFWGYDRATALQAPAWRFQLWSKLLQCPGCWRTGMWLVSATARRSLNCATLGSIAGIDRIMMNEHFLPPDPRTFGANPDEFKLSLVHSVYVPYGSSWIGVCWVDEIKQFAVHLTSGKSEWTRGAAESAQKTEDAQAKEVQAERDERYRRPSKVPRSERAQRE